MESTEKKSGTLQTKRVIPHAPEDIYAAFADPARLAKWWGPKDFRNTIQIFEFETGGTWNFVMHGPDGHDFPNKCVFRELSAGRKVVVEHVSAPRFRLSVLLNPSGNGTEVIWIQDFEEPEVAEAVRHIAEPGNEQNLDRLQMHLRGDL